MTAARRLFACLLTAIVLLSAFILPSCASKRREPSDTARAVEGGDLYTLEVTRHRKITDLELLRSDPSPLEASDKELFQGLAYFPPDRRFAFATVLDRFPKPESAVIGTSKNRPRTMLCIGTLPFDWEGATYRLRVYTSTDPAKAHEWFIPFTDATNGTDSYGAGRFLDISAKSDSVTLDFNYAYNPYCAYSHRFDCPVPPRENALPVAIRAGEKNYPLHGDPAR
jgi:uncharacterized protein (DUF1684 family)